MVLEEKLTVFGLRSLQGRMRSGQIQKDEMREDSGKGRQWMPRGVGRRGNRESDMGEKERRRDGKVVSRW